MNKALPTIASLLAAALLLSGCSALNKEYVSVKDYKPTVQEQSVSDGKISVRNYAGLKQALLTMAYSGMTEAGIVFDAAYDGDTTEDMASACWAVRTQDALCAYCVENIAYELNKIVTINEATVYLSYSGMTEAPESISHLAFSTEAEDVIERALRSGDRRVALLVGRSALTGDDMAAEVVKVYQENPTIVPCEPRANVTVFSGNGSQRLYEISLDYRMGQEELDQRRARLEALDLFSGDELTETGEGESALLACQYLVDHCALTDDETANTAYAALIDGEADSEGVAFAYVELCRRLGVDCQIIYGQRDWKEYCWNMIRLEGSWYHVDVTRAMQGDLENGFLFNDQRAWGAYRWDVSSYPRCSGELRYYDVLPAPESEGEAPEESENEEPEEIENGA